MVGKGGGENEQNVGEDYKEKKKKDPPSSPMIFFFALYPLRPQHP